MRLTLDQIRLVRQSYQFVRHQLDELTDAFYSALMRSDRRYRELFESAHMENQSKMFARTLTLLVDHIDERKYLEPYLRGLGAMHSAFGVDASHFGAFGDCLIEALKERSSGRFTPEHRMAWRKALSVFFQLMRQGTAASYDDTIDVL